MLSGIRQAAELLRDRAGAPDLGNTTAEDCENQDLLALAPGACQISADNPQGHRTVTVLTSSFVVPPAVWSALDY